MEQKVHQMEANYLVTGHLVLTCPTCGHSVQIDPDTLERKTLADGAKMTAQHTWTMGGLCVGTAGSKEKPEDEDTPLDGPGCACSLSH